MHNLEASKNIEGLLTAVLVEALETMAFISPLPAEPGATLPPRSCRVLISFQGTFNGSMLIASTEAFAAQLALNLVGVGPSTPDASQCAHDALKELANVTCGLLLRRLGGSFQLGLPVFNPPEQAAQPNSHAGSHSVTLDAEGELIVTTVLKE